MIKMNITVDECYELKGDYQNQFLGKEVFPEPSYKKIKLSERSINQVHYNDVYILEPLHYYYVTFKEKIDKTNLLEIQKAFYFNGILMELDFDNNKIYLFNASQNIIYLQKGVVIGKVILNE